MPPKLLKEIKTFNTIKWGKIGIWQFFRKKTNKFSKKRRRKKKKKAAFNREKLIAQSCTNFSFKLPVIIAIISLNFISTLLNSWHCNIPPTHWPCIHKFAKKSGWSWRSSFIKHPQFNLLFVLSQSRSSFNYTFINNEFMLHFVLWHFLLLSFPTSAALSWKISIEIRL